MGIPLPVKGFCALLGGVLVHLTLGTIYTFGNINPYITSYMRAHSAPSTLRYNVAVWVFALNVCGQGLSMFAGGLIERRLGSRAATLCGSLFVSVGVLLSYFTIKISFYLFLLTYGLVFGFGVGIAYAPPLNVAMKWLPNYKGVANGIVVAGFGGGAFIFDQIQTAFTNPNNLKAVNQTVLNTTQELGPNELYYNQEDVLERVPNLMLLLGGCYLATQLVGVLLLFTPPQTETQSTSSETTALVSESEVDSNGDDEVSAKDKLKSSPPIVEGVHPLQMIKSRPFITLWFTFVLHANSVIFISTLWKTFGLGEVLNNDRVLATLGAVASVFNAFGRIAWGLLADFVGFKISMSLLSFCLSALMGTLYLCTNGGETMFFIWVCLIFFTFSGIFSLFPTVIAKTFGPRYISINYGLLFTSSMLAGPVGAVLSSTLSDALGWLGLFLLSAGMSFIAMILSLTFNGKEVYGHTRRRLAG